MTIYALFADDLRTALFKKGSDPYFNTLTIVCLAGFVIEITLQAIAVEGYFLSLYFWLDCVATLSMITDITWIWDSIVGSQDVSLDVDDA